MEWRIIALGGSLHIVSPYHHHTGYGVNYLVRFLKTVIKENLSFLFWGVNYRFRILLESTRSESAA